MKTGSRLYAEKHKHEATYLGHNESTRYVTIEQLLDNKFSELDLEAHQNTLLIMAAMAKNHMYQQQGEVPYSLYNINQRTRRVSLHD